MAASRDCNTEFTRLWVKAQPLVSSFVFASIRRPHDAEDVLQETATAALDDFASYDMQRPFLPWVMGIARFRILTYYRRHANEKLQFDDATLAAFAEAHASMEAESSERRHALNMCLERVRGRQRKALQMRYEEGFSVQQIAAALSTTANAISLLLHKVRKSLATCVERQLSRGGTP